MSQSSENNSQEFSTQGEIAVQAEANEKLLRLKGLLSEQLASQSKLYSQVNPVDSIFDRLERDQEMKSAILQLSDADAVKLVSEINNIQDRNEKHILNLHQKLDSFLASRQ